MDGTILTRRWACTALLTSCIAWPTGTSPLWAVDLPQAKAAIVTLHSEAGGPGIQPGAFSGDAATLLRDLGVLDRSPDGGAGLQPQTPQVVTGFRLGDEPLIVTLLHGTMRQSDSLRLVQAVGEPQRVTILAWDPASDLVVLQAAGDDQSGDQAGDQATRDEARPLTLADAPAAWGAPVQVLFQWRPGSPAVAAGIVATEHHFDRAAGAASFAIDALLHPSAQGGPVIDQAGQVVGVVTASGAAGRGPATGTALGLNSVRALVDFVRQGGRGGMPKPRLGVALGSSPTGVLVRSTADGSAAQQAGIQVGDRIVSVDDQPVQTPGDLIVAVNAKRPGDPMRVTIERAGQTQQLTVTLGEMPPQLAELIGASGPVPVTPRNRAPRAAPPVDAETIRQWFEQQSGQPLPPAAGGRPPLSATPPRSVAPQAAPPATPPLPDGLNEKLDALSDQLRQLRDQVQELRAREPNEKADGLD